METSGSLGGVTLARNARYVGSILVLGGIFLIFINGRSGKVSLRQVTVGRVGTSGRIAGVKLNRNARDVG